jgi:hypothetical protein
VRHDDGGAWGLDAAAVEHAGRWRRCVCPLCRCSFIIVKVATPPGEEPAVMVYHITVDPNPTADRTDGDVTFQPAVEVFGVV